MTRVGHDKAERGDGEPGPTLVPRRPLLRTIAAWVFIATGGGGILKDLVPLATSDAAGRAGVLGEGIPMLALIWTIRALAVVGGVAVLRGQAWGRWLLVVWMVLHVVISLQHSIGEAAAHVVIFSVLAWALFRPESEAYVRAAGSSGRA